MSNQKLDYKAFGLRVNPWGQATANGFGRICALRGISGVRVEWRDEDNAYFVNGERMGESLHTCIEWLNRQPGVEP